MPSLKRTRGTLYYERHGQGPALLLIHGLGSSGEDWAPQVEAFAASHTVIAPDLRGHGRSRGDARGVTLPGFAQDVAAVLQDAGVAQADVVGLSLGGAVGFQLALDHPQCVRSLTIVNSSPEFVAHNGRERLMILQRQLIARLLPMPRMGKALAPRLFPDDPALQAQFIERFARNNKRNYLATLKALIGWSVGDRLQQIGCKTLVVSADQDYTPVATKQAYVDRLPDARLVVIPNAHHAVTAERPQAFNQVLSDFLAEAAVAASGPAASVTAETA